MNRRHWPFLKLDFRLMALDLAQQYGTSNVFALQYKIINVRYSVLSMLAHHLISAGFF
jgi:hypothetical protein